MKKVIVIVIAAHLNHFTAPACKISGLTDAQTPLKNSVCSGPITHLLSVLCVWMKIFSHANAKTQKGLRVSNNFSLLLVVFKCHHGSERVNTELFWWRQCTFRYSPTSPSPPPTILVSASTSPKTSRCKTKTNERTRKTFVIDTPTYGMAGPQADRAERQRQKQARETPHSASAIIQRLIRTKLHRLCFPLQGELFFLSPPVKRR